MYAASLFLAYLLGSIPFGLLLTRAAKLGDIRTIGSGNIGATNVLRTGNKKLAAATLLLDAGKGAAAVWLARELAPWWLGNVPVWAGLAAVTGHVFSVFLRFRGGKGVATGLGAIFALDWRVGLFMACAWLAVFAATRASALAALLAYAWAPFFAWHLLHASSPLAVMVWLLALLILYTHRSNIRRLLHGNELRFTVK